MPVPIITAVRLNGAAHRAQLPLLVLGPAAGRAATELWLDCVAYLSDAFDVLAWDLPGHGHNRSVADPSSPAPSLAELAAGVLRVVDDVLAQRDEIDGAFAHAGVGVGGEVGVRLREDVPDRVRTALRLDELIGDPAAMTAYLRCELLGELLGEPPLVDPDTGPDRELARALTTLASLRGRLAPPALAAALDRAAASVGLTADDPTVRAVRDALTEENR